MEAWAVAGGATAELPVTARCYIPLVNICCYKTTATHITEPHHTYVLLSLGMSLGMLGMRCWTTTTHPWSSPKSGFALAPLWAAH